MAKVRRNSLGFFVFTNSFIATICFVGIICQSVPYHVYSQFISGSFNRNGFGQQPQQQQTPQSPCPGTFQYQSNGYEVYGVGQIQPGQYQIGTDIVMMAHLIVATQLPTSYYGKIRITGTPEQIVTQMYNNEPIQFEINFPTQDPLPTISSILVNGNSICAADQFAQTNGFFTRVALQYMFKPIVSGNFRPRPTSNFGGNSGGGVQSNIFTTNNNNPSVSFPTALDNNQSPSFVGFTTKPPQPATDSINLIQNHNNFDLNFNNQPPVTTTAAPSFVTRAPVTVTSKPAASTFELGCGRIPKPFTPLIYGGTTLSKGDWPFMAALHHYALGSLKFKCGATIISRTTIISAAHCFYNRRQRLGAEDVLAFIGHFNLKRLQEEGSRIINLASVVIHPDYRTQSELYSDIAVGKLSETLVFSEFIQPACLWTGAAEQSLIVGRNGVIVGWGLDESGMQTAEPKRVEVPIVSDQKCLRSHDGFGKITSDRTFCAGWRNGSEGPCAGDSGSGLMLNQDGKWFLRGLVSVSLKDSTTGSCDLHEFVVFTDVASFVSWITTLL